MDEIRIGSLISLGVGVIIMGIGAFLFFRTRKFLASAATTKGTVTDNVESTDSEGGTSYQPVVQFETPEGQKIEFTDSLGTNPPKKVGSVVTVKYSPVAPQKARIGTWYRLWLAPTLLIGMGLVFGPLGAVGLLIGPDDGSETTNQSVIPAGGAPDTSNFLTLNTPAGSSQVTSECDQLTIRSGGTEREVQLRMQGRRDIKFTAKPFTGPGTYLPGTNLTAEGNVFTGDSPPLAGSVMFDGSGETGSIGLTQGGVTLAGLWSCRGAVKDEG